MKRRFAVTLLAVAIASFGASAHAIAPVIGNFQSPVIADDTPVSGSNIFVYPDVFNLDNKATDNDGPTTSSAGIIWSYVEDSGTYRINDVDPINILADDPNNPGAKEIGRSETGDPADVDSVNRTITFRNARLSPVGGPNVDPGPPGLVAIDSRPLTLIASDGSSYSMRTFMVYTHNDGTDRLSGLAAPEVVLPQTNPQTLGWTSQVVIGTPTMSAVAGSGPGSGLCINSTSPVTSTEDQFAQWISPYEQITLVQNAVYRIRINVNSPTAIPAGQTPFWDFVLDNIGPTQFQQKYAGNWLFWDTNGSANSAGLAAGSGRHTFDLWFTPLPVMAADWNDPTTGEFAPGNDGLNDARLQFRVLDVVGAAAGGNPNAAVDGHNDIGQLCMNDIEVSRIDINDLVVDSTISDIPLVSSATHSVTNIFAGSTNASFGASGVTVTPVGNGWGDTNPATDVAEIVSIDAGDTNIDFGNGSTLGDNWPIPWQDDQLLMLTASISAANATGETNPPDALRLGFDVVTSEILAGYDVLSGSGVLGMPKNGAATEYKALFFTHNRTSNATAIPEYAAVRTRVQVICNDSIAGGGAPDQGNNGGIIFSSQRVDVIDTSVF